MIDPVPFGRMRAVMVATLLLLLPGCSDPPESNETAGKEATPHEAATASADGLLQHAAELLRSGDHEAYAGLYYAENDEQADTLELIRTVGVARARLDRAMRELYGEQHDKPYANPRRFGAISDFSITQQELQRAQAQVVRENGSTLQVYLIEVDGRWRISCFTEEYDSSLKPPLAAAQRWAAEACVCAAEEVTADVRAGKYASIDEARAAYEEALSGRKQAEESRIYVDEKYHFRVVTPAGWTRLPVDMVYLPGEVRCACNPEGRPENIAVFIQKPEKAASAEELLKSSTGALPESAIVEEAVRDVAGTPAMWLVFTGPGTGSGFHPQGAVLTLQHWVAIPHGREVLVLVLTAPASDAESARRAFDEMLDSLVLMTG